MSSAYYDTTAALQVVGDVFLRPQLLDEYTVTDEDLVEPLHRVIFGAIYKIHESGVDIISIENISDYLAGKPKSNAVFETNKGAEWLKNVSERVEPDSFKFYYDRLKKMTLLRAYDRCGIDVRSIYDPNLLDSRKMQIQDEQLDSLSLIDIATKVDDEVEKVKERCLSSEFSTEHQAGDGIDELIERLQQYPEEGLPLYGKFVNTINRGARLSKYYLRSAPSGVGKSRSLIADACTIGCRLVWDKSLGDWIINGPAESTLFITTEQQLDEVQTMMLAFLSQVNEEHILNGVYEEGEIDRVRKAAQILKDSPLYIEELPDFSIQDIENIIKKHHRQHNVNYVFLDYIHTSMKILQEVTQRSGGVKIREDNVLFMLSIKLKDLCNELGIFLESATQLNGTWKEDTEMPDQNLLRGAKSISDKIDYGSIILPATQRDIDSLDILLQRGMPKPDIKISVYKNRRGRYKGIYLWCKNDLGTCRIDPQFVTTWDYQLIDMPDTKINIEESAF